MQLYEVKEGTINGRIIGETIELEDKEAEKFGPKYLKPIKTSAKSPEDEDEEDEDGAKTNQKYLKPIKTTDIKSSKTK